MQSTQVSNWSIRIFRIALSGIFINAGISHLTQPLQVLQRILKANFRGFAESFGDPYWLGIISGYVLLLAGIMLSIGLYTRIAATLLFFTLIPITITIQMGNGIMHGPLWKNVALFGGLLFFMINSFPQLNVLRFFNKNSNA